MYVHNYDARGSVYGGLIKSFKNNHVLMAKKLYHNKWIEYSSTPYPFKRRMGITLHPPLLYWTHTAIIIQTLLGSWHLGHLRRGAGNALPVEGFLMKNLRILYIWFFYLIDKILLATFKNIFSAMAALVSCLVTFLDSS